MTREQISCNALTVQTLQGFRSYKSSRIAITTVAAVLIREAPQDRQLGKVIAREQVAADAIAAELRQVEAVRAPFDLTVRALKWIEMTECRFAEIDHQLRSCEVDRYKST